MKPFAKLVSRKIVYDGFCRISDCELQPRSQNPARDYVAPIRREVLECSDSVAVLVHAPEAAGFLLCREFRTGAFFNAGGDDPFVWQCVAGMIDKGRSPEETARAELHEEAGLEAVTLTKIGAAYSSPGRITEKTHLFMAEVAGVPETGLFGLPEEGEEISTHLIPRLEAFRMMDAGEIMDSMTLLALNWFRWAEGLN